MVAWILIGLLILVVAAVPVAAVLGILSFVLDEIAMDGRLTLGIGEIVWDKSKEFILVAVQCLSCLERLCFGLELHVVCMGQLFNGCHGSLAVSCTLISVPAQSSLHHRDRVWQRQQPLEPWRIQKLRNANITRAYF